MKNTDLSKVFVPVKISVIRDEEKAKDIVPRISNYANSQTAVKNSDFSSNDPYLVQMEHFSRQEWVPNGNQKSEENGILNVHADNILTNSANYQVSSKRSFVRTTLKIIV